MDNISLLQEAITEGDINTSAMPIDRKKAHTIKSATAIAYSSQSLHLLV